uniref:Uncharacterized protein n=1 Tax=Oryza barthii TaxID=65489 RepID=A0A0D3GUA5_9ORYZ
MGIPLKYPVLQTLNPSIPKFRAASPILQRTSGAKSLRCLNLRRHKLFNTTPPPVVLPLNGDEDGPKNKQAMHKIVLPTPSFNLRAPHFFPAAADRRVFSLDQSGRAFLLDAESPRMVILPRLQKPNLEPIALYIPCPKLDLDGYGSGSGGGNLFIMDRIVKPKAGCNHFEFEGEALIYSKHSPNILCKEVDKWTLPFQGKVEYVPELKLWFGFSAEDGCLAAANLSGVGSR